MDQPSPMDCVLSNGSWEISSRSGDIFPLTELCPGQPYGATWISAIYLVQETPCRAACLEKEFKIWQRPPPISLPFHHAPTQKCSLHFSPWLSPHPCTTFSTCKVSSCTSSLRLWMQQWWGGTVHCHNSAYSHGVTTCIMPCLRHLLPLQHQSKCIGLHFQLFSLYFSCRNMGFSPCPQCQQSHLCQLSFLGIAFARFKM